MIAFLPATIVEHAMIVDRLGYSWCLDCHVKKHATGAFVALDGGEHLLRGVDELEICDRCGRAIVKCTALIVEGTAAVEYGPCKIF